MVKNGQIEFILIKIVILHSNIYDFYPSDVKIQVNPGDYEQYPYMDSFCIYKVDEGLLYTTDDDIDRPFYILHETNGEFEERY